MWAVRGRGTLTGWIGGIRCEWAAAERRNLIHVYSDGRIELAAQENWFRDEMNYAWHLSAKSFDSGGCLRAECEWETEIAPLKNRSFNFNFRRQFWFSLLQSNYTRVFIVWVVAWKNEKKTRRSGRKIDCVGAATKLHTKLYSFYSTPLEFSPPLSWRNSIKIIQSDYCWNLNMWRGERERKNRGR